MRLLIFILLLSVQSFGQNFVFPAVYAAPGPPPPVVGIRTLIYDEFTGGSLDSRWFVRRPDKQTLTVSGGELRVQVNTDTIPSMVGFDYSNVNAQCMMYDTSYGLTSVRNYVEEIKIKINKINDTTIGAFLGVYSPFPLQLLFSNFALAQFSTADSLKFLAGKDTMFSVPPAFRESISTFSFNTTDWFILRNTTFEGTILVTIKNVSTGDSINKYYTRDFTHGSYPSRPNYFWFGFGGMGRTDMNVDYILVTTTEELNPTHLFVGNSITTGYNATSADSAYANILKRSTADSIQIWAGGGMGVDEVLATMERLVEVNPQYVFLNLGTNNTYNGGNSAKYQSIVDSFTNRGFTVYPCLIVNGGDPTSGGGWNQFIKTTYASSYIDLWTAGWNTMTIGNGEMYDGVHPTLSGHQKLAALIQTLKPLLFPGSLGYASCPYVLPFETRSNFTENTPGTYTLTSAASDGNATSSITLPAGVDSVYAYFEYQSADGFQSAISWDTISTQSTPYYSQCKFNVFAFATEYWTQYNQEGAINATVSAVDGDLVGLIRRGTTIYAAYYRGGLWHNLVQFTGSHNTTLYQYISSSNDGSTSLKLRNLKYCIY